MKIIINEWQHKKLFCLKEGKQSDQAKTRTYEVIKNGNSWLSKCMDQPCQEDNGQGKTNFEYEYQNLVSHWTRDNLKYTPVIANVLYNQLGYRGTNEDVEKVNTFNTIVLLINNDVKYSKLPWTEAIKYSYDDWYSIFQQTLENEEELELKKIHTLKLTKSNYIIKKITFEESQQYGNKTGGFNEQGLKICYTQSRGTWNSYTNKDSNTVYICLKNGWENVQPIHQENAPFDEYGLSMLFVIVSPKGTLTTSNTRWNHAYVDEYNQKYGTKKHTDKILSKYEISEITQTYFDEVFTGTSQISIDEILLKVKECNNIDEIYDYIDSYVYFYPKTYLLQIKNYFYLIDKTDNTILFNKPFNYGHKLDLYTVQLDNILYDVNKKQVITKLPKDVKISSLLPNNNYAIVNNGNNYNLINLQDFSILVENAQNFIPYGKSYLGIYQNNKFYVIDYEGNNINNNVYDEMNPYNSYDIVTKNDMVTILHCGVQITEKFFDKIELTKNKKNINICTNERGNRYCIVSTNEDKKALFLPSGELYPLWHSQVCGYEKHQDYEEKAKSILNWLLCDTYMDLYGLYEYYKNRDASYLDSYCEEYIEANVPIPKFNSSEEENEYYMYKIPQILEDYKIALKYALIMSGEYLFQDYEDDEYE